MTPEEAKNILDNAHKVLEDLQKIERNFQLHKIRIDSTEDKHFCLATDAISGVTFTSDGGMDIGVPTQMKEVLGRKLDKKSGVPAKWVYAENGDIVLDARNGNIVLRAQNIQLHAVDALGGQITLDASKIVNISSPIFNATSDYAHLSCAANIDIVGGSSGIHGEFANENTKGTEETDTSFFGKILTGIKKFKKFFKSNCE